MVSPRTLNDEQVLARARALADCTGRREFVEEARGFLERVVGADASMWFPWDRDDPHFMGAVWPSIAADVQRAYASGLFRDDPIYRWIQDDPAATVTCVMTLQHLRTRGYVPTPAWQEYCYAPCSIGDILCIAHVRHGRIVGNFSLHRTLSARPFSAQAVRQARVMAHLLGAVYNALPMEAAFDAQIDEAGEKLRLLTPRERIIARLASEGLGSKDIAKRTGSSRKTVDNHLSSIYGKLGLPGRAALARCYWQRTH